MNAERDNPILDWAARERQADMAWIRDNLGIFWPRAKELFRSHGRGAFVADTTWQSLDGSMPLGYFPQAIFETDESSDVRRREAEDTDSAQALQYILLQTFEQYDGYCLDEEAERQVLAAILSSVITDLLGKEPPPGGHSQSPDNGAVPPTVTY